MFKKILVPLDQSEHSSKALDVAIQIAKKFTGEITLIHVYSSVLPIVKPGSPTLTSVPVLAPEYSLKMIDITRDTGNKILAEGRKRVGNEGIKVQTILEEGHVVQEIVRVSREGKFDLIIMGARGVSHIKEMLMGSVTDGVMHHVTCPVLIIR